MINKSNNFQKSHFHHQRWLDGCLGGSEIRSLILLIGGLKRRYKVVRRAFRCAQHPKAGRNTQHLSLTLQPKKRRRNKQSLFYLTHKPQFGLSLVLNLMHNLEINSPLCPPPFSLILLPWPSMYCRQTKVPALSFPCLTFLSVLPYLTSLSFSNSIIFSLGNFHLSLV